MGSLTDYAELELLDHVCNVAYSPVATVYLALATADPTDGALGNSFNECANSGSYARKPIAFSPAASRKVIQTGVVTFTEATGDWGNVGYWAILDDGTYAAGNVLAHGAFGTAKDIVSGNTPSVATTVIFVEISAGEMSNALAIKLLDLMFRNQAYGAPNTYVAFTTVVITDDLTGTTITEPAGGAYARVQVNPNAGAEPKWTIAAAGALDNIGAIDFTTATASWGTCVAVALCSAAADGDLLFYDNAMADQLVDDGDTATFPAGDLDVQLS